MRAAELRDFQRALDRRGKNSSPVVAKFSIKDLPGFQDATLEPKAGFLAICGGTGLGKTALLELLYLALAPQPADEIPPAPPRLGNSEISITVDYPEGRYQETRSVAIPTTDDRDGFPNGAEILGLHDRTSVPVAYFADKDLSVLKEGIEAFRFGEDLLAAVKFACRKDYTSIDVFEIEAEDYNIIPLFEVIEDNVGYDSLSMATGELSVLHLAWLLFKYADAFSIILIEEPEAYLPPAAHAAIFGLLAMAAIKKRLCIIITTHSSGVASLVPDRNLVSIRRQAHRSVLPSTTESKLRVLSRLGLQPPQSAVLFVEDELARQVLLEVLAIHEFSIACTIEVVNTEGGAGTVKTALEGLPNGIKSFAFLGVLDGDMLDQVKGWPCSARLLFLPFRRSIEEEFLTRAEADPAKLGKLANRKVGAVEDELGASRGLNPHDRFRHIATALNIPEDTLARFSFQHWLKLASSRRAVKRFSSELASRLKITLPT